MILREGEPLADVERTLLAKALHTGEFVEVVARGIEADHFADPDCRELFEYAQGFVSIHKQPPSLKIVKEEFPEFSAPLSKDPLSYHMERFILKVKERMAIELVRDYHDAIEDPEQLVDIELRALEMARALTEVVPSPRASRFSEADVRIKEYERRLKSGEVHGTFFGIPTIDKETLGIQPHEMVVVAAYLGVGKSTLMQHIAYSAYLQGKTVLYISLEMEAEAILRKIDVMATKVKYHAMKALELEHGDKQQWERIAEQAHKDRHERDIVVRDDINNCTVDHVMAETLRYKPDLVLVDYLELMSTPRGVQTQHWEAVSFTGVGLKQNARVLKIPIITAAQLNRDGGKGDVSLSNVSHQSVGKHSDVIIGLAQDEEQTERQEMGVVLLKNRDGKKAHTTMRWQLETMDIGEKGIEERFPARRPKSQTMIGHQRRKSRRLEIARNTAGKSNPWAKKKSP